VSESETFSNGPGGLRIRSREESHAQGTICETWCFRGGKGTKQRKKGVDSVKNGPERHVHGTSLTGRFSRGYRPRPSTIVLIPYIKKKGKKGSKKERSTSKFRRNTTQKEMPYDDQSKEGQGMSGPGGAPVLESRGKEGLGGEGMDPSNGVQMRKKDKRRAIQGGSLRNVGIKVR